MAGKTNIAWTDSTFNPWIGCTKVGPGCDNCYAEAMDRRFYNSSHWGSGAARRRTNADYWKRPLGWNEQARKNNKRRLVFCASQADVFDNEVDPKWREDLWALIRRTPYLTWQLVTKRVGNIKAMLPKDWGNGWSNVWLIITVVNQDEASRDIAKLVTIPAAIRGLSVEPLLGPISLAPTAAFAIDLSQDYGRPHTNIHWVIVGGESAQFGKCRRFEINWARELREQCRENKVAFFMKQLGSRATFNRQDLAGLYKGKGDDPATWEEHWGINAREFPE